MKLHWPACGLPLPSGRPLCATSFAREKSAATVFTSYRADIAPLPSETVLTRKQNDADGNDTHAAGWTEFRSGQFRREIASPRARARSLWRRDYRIRVASRVCKYVCARCLWRSLRIRAFAQFSGTGKLDGEKRGILTRSPGNSRYFCYPCEESASFSRFNHFFLGSPQSLTCYIC